MKEAIGGTWLYGLVMVMIVLFTTFVSVTTNYTRTYKIKDHLISIIEKNRGVTQAALDDMSSYLGSLGYSSTGECDNDYHGFTTSGSEASNGTSANFCIKKTVISCRVEASSADSNKKVIVASGQTGYNTIPKAYYSVTTFFRLDWPILSQVIRLNVSGETQTIVMTNKNTEVDAFRDTEVCASA